MVTQSSGKLQPDPTSDLPFVGLDSVEPNSTTLAATVPFSTMRSAANNFSRGDVLYGRLRPYLNKVWLADRSGACSGEFIVFQPRADLEAEYLKWLLHHGGFVRFASHAVTGDRPRIDLAKMSGYPVPLPPLDTQRRIVTRIDELFSELDDGETALGRARADLETYRKSLLKAAVTGELTADWRAANPPAETGEQLLQRILADRKARWEADPKNKGKHYQEPELSSFDAELELPSSWSTCTPEAVCHFITKGTTPPKNLNGEGSASVIPFLRVTNLTKTGALNLDDLQFVSAAIHEGFLARSICEVNDVLMNIVGPPLGQVSIVPDDYPTWNINQAIARFRPLLGITAEFLALTLQSGLVQGWLLKRAKTTAGQVNLTLELCRTAPIPLPPIDEQSECVRIFMAKDQSLRELISYLEPSSSLRQSILAAAFRGELVQ